MGISRGGGGGVLRGLWGFRALLPQALLPHLGPQNYWEVRSGSWPLFPGSQDSVGCGCAHSAEGVAGVYRGAAPQGSLACGCSSRL